MIIQLNFEKLKAYFYLNHWAEIIKRINLIQKDIKECQQDEEKENPNKVDEESQYSIISFDSEISDSNNL